MKKSTVLIVLSVVFGASMWFAGCSNKKDENMNPPVTMTLYDSLGGTTLVADPSNSSQKIEKGRLGIRSVVDSTIFVIAADTALNKFFTVLLSEVTNNNTTGFEALSRNLTDFFCVATGAKNFVYGGKNMVAAHDPAQNPRMNGKASSADFDRFGLVTSRTPEDLPEFLPKNGGRDCRGRPRLIRVTTIVKSGDRVAVLLLIPPAGSLPAS